MEFLVDRTIGHAYSTVYRLSVVCDVLYSDETTGSICMNTPQLLLLPFMSLKLSCCSLHNVPGSWHNTGAIGGIIRLLEVKLSKPLQWLTCILHATELPLRHLMKHLDGRTSGPIDRLLDGGHAHIDFTNKLCTGPYTLCGTNTAADWTRPSSKCWFSHMHDNTDRRLSFTSTNRQRSTIFVSYIIANGRYIKTRSTHRITKQCNSRRYRRSCFICSTWSNARTSTRQRRNCHTYVDG